MGLQEKWEQRIKKYSVDDDNNVRTKYTGHTKEEVMKINGFALERACNQSKEEVKEEENIGIVVFYFIVVVAFLIFIGTILEVNSDYSKENKTAISECEKRIPTLQEKYKDLKVFCKGNEIYLKEKQDEDNIAIKNTTSQSPDYSTQLLVRGQNPVTYGGGLDPYVYSIVTGDGVLY